MRFSTHDEVIFYSDSTHLSRSVAPTRSPRSPRPPRPTAPPTTRVLGVARRTLSLCARRACSPRGHSPHHAGSQQPRSLAAPEALPETCGDPGAETVPADRAQGSPSAACHHRCARGHVRRRAHHGRRMRMPGVGDPPPTPLLERSLYRALDRIRKARWSLASGDRRLDACAAGLVLVWDATSRCHACPRGVETSFSHPLSAGLGHSESESTTRGRDGGRDGDGASSSLSEPRVGTARRRGVCYMACPKRGGDQAARAACPHFRFVCVLFARCRILTCS